MTVRLIKKLSCYKNNRLRSLQDDGRLFLCL